MSALAAKKRRPGDMVRESRIQRVIKEARATLMNPTRPQTPKDDSRGFYVKGISSRQGTPVTLQPLEKFDGNSTIQRLGNTPSVGEGKLKRDDKDGYWNLESSTAGDRPPSPLVEEAADEAGADGEKSILCVDIARMLPLLDPGNSHDTHCAGLDKINQLVDQLSACWNPGSDGAMSRHPPVRRLLRSLRKLTEAVSTAATAPPARVGILSSRAVLITHDRRHNPPASVPQEDDEAAFAAAVMPAVKLLYVLSKGQTNDPGFKADHALEPILRLLEAHAHAADNRASPGEFPGAGKQSAAVHEKAGLDLATLAAGILKNVSNDTGVQQSLATLGAIRVVTSVCGRQLDKLTQRGSAANPGSNEPLLRSRIDLLIQATGCLRNLSVPPEHAALFTKLGTVSVLYPACFKVPLHNFRDLVLNASRVLAKLSHTDACRVALERSPANVGHLVETLKLYNEQHAIAVRVLFTLGNLVQSSEVTREAVAKSDKVVAALVALFVEYADADEALTRSIDDSEWPPEIADDATDSCIPEQTAYIPATTTTTTGTESKRPGRAVPKPLTEAVARDAGPPQPLGTPEEGERPEEAAGREREGEVAESDDRLVKATRVVANLAISPALGPLLAEDERLVGALMRLVQTKNVNRSEELVLNAVCCITNMSYYTHADGKPSFVNQVLVNQVEIADAIAMLLMHDHADAVVEVARAFGNFSRSNEMRLWMMETRIDEACAILVDHSDHRVVVAVCGILLNFSADPDHVQLFAQHELMPRLEELLAVTDPSDFEFLCLLFKLYHNPTDHGLLSVPPAEDLRAQVLSVLAAAQATAEEHPSLPELHDVAAGLVELLSSVISANSADE
ncbi:hypothetical protein DIPPA_30883 [Diplonema papillatum]|nr:hypothetical protein DIPPA_30883 [Diplonema papillatum]